MTNKKVLISSFEYPHHEIEKKVFAEAGIEVVEYHHEKDADISELVKDMDALLVQYVQVGQKVIDNLNKCEIIVRYGIGYDNVNAAYAGSKGIVVSNVPDYSVEEVADHTVALLLSQARGIGKLDRSMRAGKFNYEYAKPLFRLKGKTLGLLGFGRIPRAIVEKVKGFGFNVLVYDPYVDSKSMEAVGVAKAELKEIFAESDFVAVNCPLTERTQGIVNEEALRSMKKTAYLINTARGPVVDEKALIRALKEGWIAGAGLDVFVQEPLSVDSELLELDNVILTPHAGWYTEDSNVELKIKAAQEIVRVLNGEQPRNAVNKAIYPAVNQMVS